MPGARTGGRGATGQGHYVDSEYYTERQCQSIKTTAADFEPKKVEIRAQEPEIKPLHHGATRRSLHFNGIYVSKRMCMNLGAKMPKTGSCILRPSSFQRATFRAGEGVESRERVKYFLSARCSNGGASRDLFIFSCVRLPPLLPPPPPPLLLLLLLLLLLAVAGLRCM